MIFEKFFKRKNTETFVYNQLEIDNLKDSYLRQNIKSLSPIVSKNINNIYTVTYLTSLDKKLSSEEQKQLQDAQNYLNSRNIDPDTYLEELAKVNIFITEKVKCPDDFTREMLIESAFASYQYQKINNLPFAEFESFFNASAGHPFENFTKIVIEEESKGFITDVADSFKQKSFKPLIKHLKTGDNGKCSGNVLYLNDKMDFKNYTLSLMKTITHELQHKVSHNGTYEKHFAPLFVPQAVNGLNEMCTEWNAEKIISTFLDTSGKENVFGKLSPGKKTFSYITDAKDYKEITQFFECLDMIFDGKLKNLYYNRKIDFPSGANIKTQKLKSEIYDFCDKGYAMLHINGNYYENIISEENFDAMIDSFSSLAEKYVRSLGLNKSTTPESLEGAITFKKVEEFFNTFNSITFQKNGENFTQAKLIKEKVLGAIYYNDKSSEEAINRLNNKRTFVKEFEENCKTATETIEKSKTSESEITTSIENTKGNETTKDNSKSDDLEI